VAKADAPIKILADKEITKAFEIFGIRISGKALEALQKAGGKVVGLEESENKDQK
jgi:ribosomal protein L18E